LEALAPLYYLITGAQLEIADLHSGYPKFKVFFLKTEPRQTVKLK